MSPLSPVFRPGVPGLIPDAWILGSSRGTAAPAVVSVHGINRGVEAMVAHLMPRARETGRTLVVPHFDEENWRRFQRAACRDRADFALLRLMSDLRAEGLVSPAPFDLCGFSGGAQFAHRFTWLYPAMVGRLCVASPGWWTFPDPETAWPMGMANGPQGEGHGFHLRANLRRFLDRSITICVGSDDTTRDENLRKSAAMDAQQGAHRVARATRWRAAMVAAARREGMTPRIDFRVLPGCGHDFVECATHGGLDHDFIASTTRSTGCANPTFYQTTLRMAHVTERTSA